MKKCKTCGQPLRGVGVGSKWKSPSGLIMIEFVTDDGEIYFRRDSDGQQDAYECLEDFHSVCTPTTGGQSDGE